MSSFQLFDPQQETSVVERRLPHWSQAGTLCFITFRTWDSIPKPVLDAWLAQRHQWLRDHDIDPCAINWRRHLEQLGRPFVETFQRLFSQRWNEELDSCHGTCVLRSPDFSRIVADSFHHADGRSYELTDYVVMPNHAHVLAAFVDDEGMLAQCESWKRFTATQINPHLQRKGRFWQQDGFDHLVRSLRQFEHLRRYIGDNARRSGLGPNEFVHYSKEL